MKIFCGFFCSILFACVPPLSLGITPPHCTMQVTPPETSAACKTADQPEKSSNRSGPYKAFHCDPSTKVTQCINDILPCSLQTVSGKGVQTDPAPWLLCGWPVAKSYKHLYICDGGWSPVTPTGPYTTTCNQQK